MLPIFRMIPVGGVFIAIVALVQALTLPGPSRTRLIRVEAPASGPLIEREQHPEWRQFLILAAIHRAQEILALRSLPDAPARTTVQRAAAPADAAPAPNVVAAPALPDVSPPAPMQPSGEKSPAQAPEQEMASVVSPDVAGTGPPPAAASDSAGGATAASADADAEKAEAVAAIPSEDTAAPAPAATALPTPTDMPPSSPAPSDVTASIPKAGAPMSEVAPAASTAEVSAAPERGTVATATAAAENVASVAPPPATPNGAISANRPPQPSDAIQPPVAGAGDEAATTAASKPTVIAELPKDQAEAAPAADDANVTGSVVKSAATTVPVGIGEASSLELPVVLPRPRPNLIKLPRARPAVIPPLRHAAGHHGKPKAPPANSHRPPPDLFSALFDKNYRRSAPASGQQPGQPSPRTTEHTGQSP